jgi:hypothetical protein
VDAKVVQEVEPNTQVYNKTDAMTEAKAKLKFSIEENIKVEIENIDGKKSCKEYKM